MPIELSGRSVAGTIDVRGRVERTGHVLPSLGGLLIWPAGPVEWVPPDVLADLASGRIPDTGTMDR